MKSADETKDLKIARSIVAKSGMGNAMKTAMFERAEKKGVVTYSHTHSIQRLRLSKSCIRNPKPINADTMNQ